MWLEGVRGGNMKHGLLSGLASATGGSAIEKYGGRMSRALKVAANAVIGGTAEELGGGKFANGAITGAFSMLFNDLMHSKDNFTDEELKGIYDAYPKRNEVATDKLYENIGGPLEKWYKDKPGDLANTGAVRLSVALNESGNTIPEAKGTYKGGDEKNYFISVSAMSKYLTKTYGTPATLRSNQSVKNAIIWQSNCNWRDATGHLDIIYRGNVGSYYYEVCGTVKYWQ